jgi:hypothetical protein
MVLTAKVIVLTERMGVALRKQVIGKQEITAMEKHNIIITEAQT